MISNFSAFSLIALEVGKAVVSRIDDCSAAVEPADRTACSDRKLVLITTGSLSISSQVTEVFILLRCKRQVA